MCPAQGFHQFDEFYFFCGHGLISFFLFDSHQLHAHVRQYRLHSLPKPFFSITFLPPQHGQKIISFCSVIRNSFLAISGVNRGIAVSILMLVRIASRAIFPQYGLSAKLLACAQGTFFAAFRTCDNLSRVHGFIRSFQLTKPFPVRHVSHKKYFVVFIAGAVFMTSPPHCSQAVSIRVIRRRLLCAPLTGWAESKQTGQYLPLLRSAPTAAV